MSCSTCSKCRWIRASAFCGTKRLTEKQLYNKNGFCSEYEPKDREAEEMEAYCHQYEPAYNPNDGSM